MEMLKKHSIFTRVLKIIRLKDIASEEFPVSDKEAHKLMRIALPIGQNFGETGKVRN